jgi:hypothetical protein
MHERNRHSPSPTAERPLAHSKTAKSDWVKLPTYV